MPDSMSEEEKKKKKKRSRKPSDIPLGSGALNEAAKHIRDRRSRLDEEIERNGG